MIASQPNVIDAVLDWIVKPKPPPAWTPARITAPGPPMQIKQQKAKPAKASRIYTRDEALTDILANRKKPIPSQQFLAARWGVTKGAVSKWLARWENEGLVKRKANGRFKTVRAA